MGKPSAQVIPLQSTSFCDIRIASVHGEGNRVQGSRNEVWWCPAYAGAEGVMLYVKPALSVRQIVAELVSAQVGICLGLPCAPPFLVSLAPHRVGRPRGPVMLTYGCLQVGPNGPAFPVRNLSLMIEMLRKAKHAEGTCVLDEWIANSVRGPGDIVFDPQQAVWLIDHEGAFDAQLRPDEAVTNWLAQQLTALLDRNQRAALLIKLNKIATTVRHAKLGKMPPELAQIPGGEATYKAVIEFLAVRLQHLGSLLSARIIPEQLPLENLESNSDDSASIA